MHPSLERPIQLRLMGAFDIAIHDVSLAHEMTHLKPRLLLAILALAQGQSVSRVHLANMLWPESTQDNRGNLRQAVFVVRKLLEKVPHAWVHGRDALSLNERAFMVDVLALSGAYEGLSLQQRLSYDRGKLLENTGGVTGTVFSGWLQQWQVRLDRERRLVRTTLLSELTASKNYADALKHAKHWVTQYPDDESCHSHYIQLLRDTGDIDAALHAMSHCQTMMRVHYDREPSQQTLSLLQMVPAATPLVTVSESASDPIETELTGIARPIAILAVSLRASDVKLDHLKSVQRVHQIATWIVTEAEKTGMQGHVNADGSVFVVSGFLNTSEKPAHDCVKFAQTLREAPLMQNESLCVGIHAEVVQIHGGDVVSVLMIHGFRALQLAYLARESEILLSESVHDRVSDQFMTYAETRDNRPCWLLGSQRFVRKVGRMFGRMREFDALVRLWTRLPLAMPAMTVLVRGDAGMGKTLLANAMAEYVLHTGGQVRRLQCLQTSRLKPFHPLLDERIIDGSVDAPLTDTAVLDKVIENFSSREYPDTPLLVVLEDVHWADPSTLALMEQLKRHVWIGRTLFLITARVNFTEIEADNEVVLKPLDRRATAELVTYCARGQNISARQRDEIVSQSEGVPLFAQELVRQLSLNVAHDGIPVINDLFAARLLSLSAPALAVIRLAAVAGSVTDALLSHVARLHGLGLSKVISALDELRLYGLLQEGLPAQLCHTLARKAVYDTLDVKERIAHHRMIAEFLMAQSPFLVQESAASIAHHLNEVRDPEASLWWSQAGRHALNQSSVQEAQIMMQYARQSLEYIEDSRQKGKSELACCLLEGSVMTLLRGAGDRQTQAIYQRIEELRHFDDVTASCDHAQWGQWLVTFNTMPHAQSLLFAEQFAQRAQNAKSSIVQGCALFATGQARLFMGDIARAENDLRASIAFLSKRQMLSEQNAIWILDRRLSAQGLLAWALAFQARFDAAAELIQKELLTMQDAKVTMGHILCQAVLCETERLRDDTDAVIEAIQKLETMVQTGGGDTTFWRVIVLCLQGWVQVRQGEHRGLAAVERTLEFTKQTAPVWQAFVELILTDCHNRLGMSQAALKSVEQAYGLIEFYGTNSLYAAALCQEAVALHALGQSQSAFERWQRAIVESRSLGLSVFSQRAQRQLDAAMRGAPVI